MKSFGEWRQTASRSVWPQCLRQLCAVGVIALVAGTSGSVGIAVAQDEEKLKAEDALWAALSSVPEHIDASPLPGYRGDFISIGASGTWNLPSQPFAYASASAQREPKADCSPEAIIHYARKAPGAFDADQKGMLYGVRTHTPATRLTTRYWDMPGFNSCALVVYAILKRAGCGWAKYTANAKSIYDMADRNGWRPSRDQIGGCMVAWNSRWEGKRRRIGARQKQVHPGTTLFRHVGIATGSWLSVDNNSWLSRPTTFFTFRPISYEEPIFLCPPQIEVQTPERPVGTGKK